MLLLLFWQAYLDLCCRQRDTIHGRLPLAALLMSKLPWQQVEALLLLLLLLQSASGRLLLVLMLQCC